jgi:hypothetical protein
MSANETNTDKYLSCGLAERSRGPCIAGSRILPSKVSKKPIRLGCILSTRHCFGAQPCHDRQNALASLLFIRSKAKRTTDLPSWDLSTRSIFVATSMSTDRI